MATQTIEFNSVSARQTGVTITAKLWSGTTETATLASVTENATLDGQYTGVVTDIAAGDYKVDDRVNGSYSVDDPSQQQEVTLLLATGTYVATRPSGGGAGGTDWTSGQRTYILSQLALLTVSGASVVVTSGTYMCARGDVEQVYGNANTSTWADLNNNQDADEITSRINYHIAIADNYIRSILTQGAWVMPVEGDTIPAILAYNCARLAGVLLYEGRGVSDYDSKGKPIHQLSHHKNGVDSFLKSVVYGSTDLSPLVKSSTNEAPTAS